MRTLTRPGVIPALARALGVTEGQTSTLIIGLVLGLASAAIAVPAALSEQAPAQLAGDPAAPAAPVEEPPTAFAPPADDSTAFDDAPEPDTFTLPPPTSSGPPSAGPPPSGPARTAPPPQGTEQPPQEPRTADEPPPPPARPVASVSPFAEVSGVTAGLAVARDGRVFLAVNPAESEDGAAVEVLSATGAPTARHPVEIESGSLGLRDVLLLDDAVVVVREAPASLVWIDPDSGAETRTVEIPDLPSCVAMVLEDPCEPAPVDRPPSPVAAAAAPDGTLYVTDAAQATIWRITPGAGEAEAWLRREEFISDAGLAGVAVEADGHVVVSVTRSLFAAAGGVVYRIPVDSGRPGDLEQLATTDPSSSPMGLEVAESGRIYVVLSGTGEVLVLEPGGQEADRFLDGEGDAGPQEPFSLAFAGTAVLVSGGHPEGEGRSLVVSVEVGEPGMAPHHSW